jgi:hypothetical protein
MNGDWATYFASSGQAPNTYASDIAAFKAGGGLSRVLGAALDSITQGERAPFAIVLPDDATRRAGRVVPAALLRLGVKRSQFRPSSFGDA